MEWLLPAVGFGLLGAVVGIVVSFLFLPVLFVVAVKIMDYLAEKWKVG